MKTLLVEDDASFARLLQEELTAAAGFDLLHAPNWTTARDALLASDFDVILLDLMLPDSVGLSTLDQLRTASPGTAVVVMSGIVADLDPLEPYRHGAQEVFDKSADGLAALPDLLRRAAARQEVVASTVESERAERERRARAEADLAWFDDLRSVHQSVSSAALGIKPMFQSIPGLLDRLADIYESLLEAAIRRAMYTDEPHTGPKIRAYAAELAQLRAGPREVTEVHATVLRRRLVSHADDPPGMAGNEGRLLLVEVMGYLLSEYRTQTLGDSRISRIRPAATQPRPPSP